MFDDNAAGGAGTQSPPPGEVQKTIEQVQQQAHVDDKGVPLEVKLSTGQVYRGATAQELQQQLVQAQENASRLLQEQKAELERQRMELAQWQEQVQQQPTGDDDKYNPARYYEL